MAEEDPNKGQDPSGGPAGGGGDPANGGGDPPKWYEQLSDQGEGDKPSDRAWAQTKGWQDIAGAVRSYRELEGRLGSAITLPKDASDAEGWANVWKKLGRPDTPDGYELPVPEGTDPAFAKAFASKAHELGAPAAIAKGIVEWWNGQQAEANAAAEAKAQQDAAALKQEFGGEFDTKMELARRAAERFGIDPATLDSYEKVTGTAGIIKLLVSVGAAMGEHGKIDGAPAGGEMTVDQAKSRKAEIINTPELANKLMNGDPALKAEWQKIIALEAQSLQPETAA